MRVTDIVLQWEVAQGMQIGVDIGSESDGYRITVGGYSGMLVAMGICNVSDGYCLTVGDTRRCR